MQTGLDLNKEVVFEPGGGGALGSLSGWYGRGAWLEGGASCGRGHTCLRPSPELGQDKVTLDCLPRIHENTGEVGISQGRAQLLQHQWSPQLGPRAPVLSPGGALPQPAWEVLDEGAIAQPVEDVEVGEAAAGGTGQCQRSIQ